MSLNRQELIQCSVCGARQNFTVWNSVNVTVDPHLKESLLKGKLNIFHCKRCGYEAPVVYNMLYHDMDKSLAIWLLEDDNGECEDAKNMFATFTQLQTTRTVRDPLELIEKIKLFDDGFDDFDIELFKFVLTIRLKLDMGEPFHYLEKHRTLFGRPRSLFGSRSLAFNIARDNRFETICYSLKEYEATLQRLAIKPRAPIEAWAQLDQKFILNFMEDAGLMKPVTSDGTLAQTIQVHTIGRTPEFDNPWELDEWLMSDGSTYTNETWQINRDVTAQDAIKYRDPKTGDLYVSYHIIDDEWRGCFLTRELFAEMKAIFDS